MRKILLLTLISVFAGLIFSINAQQIDPENIIKKHINSVVVNVEKAETAVKKREILNDSFERFINAIEKAESINGISETEKESLAYIKLDIQEKRDELNGLNGFSAVNDANLVNFANYYQQEYEQADLVFLLICFAIGVALAKITLAGA